MAKIRLSRIKSYAFKISSYAGPSVYSTFIIKLFINEKCAFIQLIGEVVPRLIIKTP